MSEKSFESKQAPQEVSKIGKETIDPKRAVYSDDKIAKQAQKLQELAAAGVFSR